MGILRTIFDARPEWWLLEPDQSIFASGGQTDGRLLHLAARHRDGKWAMIYLADKTEFSVNLGKLSVAQLNASWVNTQDGKSVWIGTFSNQGVKSFTTPDGWEDSLLVIESSDSTVKP
jgi:hypothetical protein